jgi:hypothetical protein
MGLYPIREVENVILKLLATSLHILSVYFIDCSLHVSILFKHDLMAFE